MNLYEQSTLIGIRNLIPPLHTFLLKRYFPDGEIFPTPDCIVEYRKGNKTLAPFVLPYKGGITIGREGYKAKKMEPPHIAPQRTLTVDDIKKKGLEEYYGTTKDPVKRAAEFLTKDLADLSEMIDRRREWMAAELLTTGKLTMTHYADEYGEKGVDFILQFYEDEFDNEYVPEISWKDPDADIYGDISRMIQKAAKNGQAVSDLVCDASVVECIFKNKRIKEILDSQVSSAFINLNFKDLPDGVSHVCTLNIYGKNISIFSYMEDYTEKNMQTGELETKRMIPEGTVILIAPKMGKCVYGTITQMEEKDREFHSYPKLSKVPKIVTNVNSDIRTLIVKSKPIVVPLNMDGWVVSKVIFEAV